MKTWSVPGFGEQRIVKTLGTWGGTSTQERQAVAHLPVAEAVEVLEAGLQERVAKRIKAFKRAHSREWYRHSDAKRVYEMLRD